MTIIHLDCNRNVKTNIPFKVSLSAFMIFQAPSLSSAWEKDLLSTQLRQLEYRSWNFVIELREVIALCKEKARHVLDKIFIPQHISKFVNHINVKLNCQLQIPLIWTVVARRQLTALMPTRQFVSFYARNIAVVPTSFKSTGDTLQPIKKMLFNCLIELNLVIWIKIILDPIN